jgi:hypothetical protein
VPIAADARSQAAVAAEPPRTLDEPLHVGPNLEIRKIARLEPVHQPAHDLRALRRVLRDIGGGGACILSAQLAVLEGTDLGLQAPSDLAPSLRREVGRGARNRRVDRCNSAGRVLENIRIKNGR